MFSVKLPRIVVATVVSGSLALSGCAATGAYVQTHPDLADEAAIATAAVGCVDQAAASVILENSWQIVASGALACVTNLLAQNFLDRKYEVATREAVLKDVLSRQDRSLKEARALDRATKSLPKLDAPVAVPAAPVDSGVKGKPTSQLVPDLSVPTNPYRPVTWSWEDLIGPQSLEAVQLDSASYDQVAGVLFGCDDECHD